MGNDYSKLYDFVLTSIKENKSRRETYEKAVNDYEYKSSFEGFKTLWKRVNRKFNNSTPIIKKWFPTPEEFKESVIQDNSFIDIIKKKKNIKITELCDLLYCPPIRIIEFVDYYRSKGYEISVFSDFVCLSKDAPNLNVSKVEKLEDKEIIFGVASDIHFGSTSCQITALNEFAEICKNNNVKYMFSPGDLVSGIKMFPGHEYDVYEMSAEGQENSAIINLPKGFIWYILGGNHDYSFITKGGGHNPLLRVSSEREDVNYVGYDEVDIPILNGVDMKMWHPSGGVPYAMSYRLQKGIEQAAYNELSSIANGLKNKQSLRFVLCGHLHIQLQAMFGSIFGAQCGTFEGKTNYLKKKGLTPNIGGYIIKATLDKNGMFKNFSAKFYVFPEIENDWKNYKHSVTNNKIEKPIFG